VWYLGSRLVLTPLILSYVSIEEYGLWSYCFVVLGYLALTAFGFNSTYIRYAADYRSRDENDKLNELFSTGLISMIIFSSVLFSIFWCLVPWLVSILGIDPELQGTARGLMIGTAAIFVVNFTLAGYQSILEGEQLITLVRKIHLIASVLEIVLIILLFQMGVGVFSLLWAYSARLFLVILLTIIFAHRVFPFLRLSVKLFRKDALKKFAGFGNQMNLLGFLALLINSVDRILITRFLHLGAVGLYEIGRKLPNIGLMLPSSIAGTVMPAASHLEGSSQQEKLKQVYLAATRYLMILSSIPYAFLILFAHRIIEVWVGRGYIESGIILATAPFLVHTMGIIGAAVAYSIGQTIGSIYFLWLVNRLFDVSWRRFADKVLSPVLLIILMGIPSFLMCNALWPRFGMSRWSGLTVLFVSGVCYVIFSFIVLVVFQKKFFSGGERKKLSSFKLPSPLGGFWIKLWRTE